jgi:uncharacterized protein
MTVDNYIESILHARAERDQATRSSSRNWLTLVGLYPLREGSNLVSTQADAAIQLPPSTAPFAGFFILVNDQVHLNLISNPALFAGGDAHENRALRLDVDGDPDILEFGQHSLMVIRRGNRYFLRLWDRQAADFVNFTGYRYFPADPLFRITATYERYDPPKVCKAINAIGIESETRYLGIARFKIGEADCELLAEESGEELLINFTDATRSDSTYPGGRYLETEPPPGSLLTLDFNLARNWPCAYTPYATCPLPPRENHLSVRIEAGEKRFH